MIDGEATVKVYPPPQWPRLEPRNRDYAVIDGDTIVVVGISV
jgi:hypothetical protein